MFPAQALAEAMLKKDRRVRLSTDLRGTRFAGTFPKAVEIVEVSSATFACGGLAPKVMAGPKIAAGVTGMAVQMMRDKPDVVVGFGGYPSIPALGAAKMLKVPRMIHEQNGVLGRVKPAFRHPCRTCGLCAVALGPPGLPDGAKGVHTGNPVRAAVLERAAAPYIPPGDYPIFVLVMGGSQGARIHSDMVPGAIGGSAGIPAQFHFAFRTRPEMKMVSVSRPSTPIMASSLMFSPSSKTSRVACPRRNWSSRGLGASSVADISVIGRPSILIPFAAAAG